eukprot:6212963-Pleurochrysis_carterae.AAC.4
MWAWVAWQGAEAASSRCQIELVAMRVKLNLACKQLLDAWRSFGHCRNDCLIGVRARNTGMSVATGAFLNNSNLQLFLLES